MSQPGERDDSELRDRLRALQVDPPDAGFSAALHRSLVAAEPPEEASPWRRLWARLGESRALWPAIGAAAAAAVLLVVGGVRLGPAGPGKQAGGIASALPSTKVAVVRVNLSTEVAVESARIRVRLPDGLVFWADGQELAQRSFEWTQPLRAGDNDIPIAVRGSRPGTYKMTVTAQIGKELVEDEVVLEVTDG